MAYFVPVLPIHINDSMYVHNVGRVSSIFSADCLNQRVIPGKMYLWSNYITFPPYHHCPPHWPGMDPFSMDIFGIVCWLLLATWMSVTFMILEGYTVETRYNFYH